jgi:hypothetical protein
MPSLSKRIISRLDLAEYWLEFIFPSCRHLLNIVGDLDELEAEVRHSASCNRKPWQYCLCDLHMVETWRGKVLRILSQVVHQICLGKPMVGYVAFLYAITRNFRENIKSKLVSLSGVTTWCLSNSLGTSYSALAPAQSS